MDKQTLILTSHNRPFAAELVRARPDGDILTLAEKTRSLEQNALLWAALTDVSRQVIWHGQRLSQDEWKDVFSAALKRQKVVPGIDGGFVVCGQRTSRMGVREFSDLIELMLAFGAERGVRWRAPDGYEQLLATTRVAA